MFYSITLIKCPNYQYNLDCHSLDHHDLTFYNLVTKSLGLLELEGTGISGGNSQLVCDLTQPGDGGMEGWCNIFHGRWKAKSDWKLICLIGPSVRLGADGGLMEGDQRVWNSVGFVRTGESWGFQ